MRRLCNELVLVAVLVVFSAFIVSYNDFVATGKAISSGEALPDWAGVPWNVFTNEPVITITHDPVEITSGTTRIVIEAKGEYLRKDFYFFNRNAGRWDAYTFDAGEGGEVVSNSEWLKGAGRKELAVDSALISQKNYIAAATCHRNLAGELKCGCRDANTCQRWQLQSFDAEKYSTSIQEDMIKYLTNPSSVPNFQERASKIVLPFNDTTNDMRVDFDGDGFVGFADFTMFAAAFNTNNATFDLNGDGTVNFPDFVTFAKNFGKRVLVAKKYILYDNPYGYIYSEYVLSTKIEKSSDDGSKYTFYIAAAPEYKFKVFVWRGKMENGGLFQYDNAKLIKDIEPKFISESNEFLDKKLDKTSRIYTVLIDSNEFEEGDYAIHLYSGKIESVFNFRVRYENEAIKSGTCTQIQRSKYSDTDSINIAFIGDMYSENDMNLYVYDVDKSVDVFIKDQTVSPYKDRINFYRANYVGDLECRFGSGCASIFNPIAKILGDKERDFCCNAEKAEDGTESLCGDRPYVINVISNEEKYGGSVIKISKSSTVIMSFAFASVGLPHVSAGVLISAFMNTIFREYVMGKNERGITAQTRIDATIFSHEIGHLVASLPDYYVIDDDCSDYRCRMCASSEQYSDKGLCYDKQGMVKWLNQWCKAKVNIFKDKNAFSSYNTQVPIRVSPYPNPFNPTRQNTTIEFNIKYESGQDPCYALMYVYSTTGQLVDVVVSDKPLPDGNHALKWDGRDMLQQNLSASGVYIYEVAMGQIRDTVKGTILK